MTHAVSTRQRRSTLVVALLAVGGSRQAPSCRGRLFVSAGAYWSFHVRKMQSDGNPSAWRRGLLLDSLTPHATKTTLRKFLERRSGGGTEREAVTDKTDGQTR